MWGFLPFFLFSLREMDRRGERQASAEALFQGWNLKPRVSQGPALRLTSKASRSLKADPKELR